MFGGDPSGLPRSKRRKFERFEKKARRQARHVKRKGVIQKEMERICQKLNIGPKPPVAKAREAVVKQDERALPKQASQKEIERTRKLNLLRDNKEEDKVIKQLEKKLFLNKRKNKNMPRSFIDEGLDYILEITDQKYKDAALAKEAAQMGVDWAGSRDREGGGKKIEATVTKRASEGARESTPDGDDGEGSCASSESDVDDDGDSDDDFVEDSSGATERREGSSEGEEDTDEVETDGDGEDPGAADSDAGSVDEEENSEDDLSSNVPKLKRERAKKAGGKGRTPGSDGDEEGSSLKEGSSRTSSVKIVKSAMAGEAKKAEARNVRKDKRKVRFNLPDVSDDDGADEDGNGKDGSSDDDGGGDDDGGEAGGPEEESSATKEGKSAKKPNKDGIWEDIYGRLRDKAGNVVTSKYVPPSKRAAPAEPSAEKKEELARLKRQLKGLLNRLSESTVRPIGCQIEELYRKFSNHDVNSMLVSSLCDVLVAAFLTPERLAMEHAMLVAYLHCNVAAEVGAYVLENMVEKFNLYYEHILDEESGKQADNCILFISYLFIFKVVHSKLIFDIVRKLAGPFRDRDVEMVLLILRSVGFGLRKHDPVALKEVVLLLQQKSVENADRVQDSRKKFMLEVLMAVRNNNIQKIPNCDPTMAERASKILRGLCRKGCSMQELNISLEDLLSAKEKGKWWVVGSAWAGTHDAKSSGTVARSGSGKTAFAEQIVELAKKHHMNTEIRKNIFCIIMTAEDYLDAGEKILRLNLSSTQEREVCHVLLHCCMKERQHNPYYAHLAKFFCKRDRRFYMMLQCAIWDKMKELDKVSRSESSNLAQFVVLLLYQEVLSLSVLKTVQFVDMSPCLIRFLRQLFLGLFAVEDAYRRVFLRVAEPPKLRLLREGVRLFLHQHLLEGAPDPELRGTLEKAVSVADAALESAGDGSFY